MVWKKDKLISVIIPCFNMGDFIEETVKSVISQTYKNLEIIIVDDGSNDEKTLNVIEKIPSLDKRIKVVKQENQKLPAARNTGVKNSSGEYIFCLDADDKIDKNYVKECLGALIKNDKDVVTTYSQQFGESENIWIAPDPSAPLLLIRNIIHVASFYKRTVWEKNNGYDSKFNGGFEDWEFWINAIENGFEWMVIEKPLFYYRVRKGSMLSDSSKNHHDLYKKIVEKHQKVFKEYAGELAELTQKMIIEKDQKINELYQIIDAREQS